MNTNLIRDVIILGAGASKSDGAPKQDELFPDFFEILQDEERMKKIPPITRAKFEKLENYFNYFWKITRDNFKDIKKNKRFPSFEECLGFLDLAYLRKDFLRYSTGEAEPNFEFYSDSDVNDIRDAMNHLITLVIHDAIQKYVKDDPTKRCKNHIKLVSNFEKAISNGREIMILALNYDLLIDRALFEKKYIPNYNVNFDFTWNLDNRPEPYKRLEEEVNAHSDSWQSNYHKISLFKIHGSLNWLFCPTCHSKYLTSGKNAKAAYAAFFIKYPMELEKNYECIKCRNRHLLPVIIPPTFYKDFSHVFLQNLYNELDKCLRYANNLFFCGYSFPDADLHIKYLFKRAESFFNRDNNNKLNVYIFNKSDSNEERIRYERFFNCSLIHWEAGKSFEDFSKDYPNIGEV